MPLKGAVCPEGNVKIEKKSSPSRGSPRGRPKEIDRELLRQLHNKGHTDREIAETLCTTKRSVANIRNSLNLSPNEKPRISEHQLRALHSSGMTDQGIADELKVSRGAVGYARKKFGLPANRHVGEHGPLLKKSITGEDADIAWLEEQQRLHAMEMSTRKIISNDDLLKLVQSAYSLNEKHNRYIYINNSDTRPADLPKQITVRSFAYQPEVDLNPSTFWEKTDLPKGIRNGRKRGTGGCKRSTEKSRFMSGVVSRN